MPADLERADTNFDFTCSKILNLNLCVSLSLPWKTFFLYKSLKVIIEHILPDFVLKWDCLCRSTIHRKQNRFLLSWKLPINLSYRFGNNIKVFKILLLPIWQYDRRLLKSKKRFEVDLQGLILRRFRKYVLKVCSKFTGEHSCKSVISINLQSNFIKITLQHECSPVTLLHNFRTPFYKNTSEDWFWRFIIVAEAAVHRCSSENVFWKLI